MVKQEVKYYRKAGVCFKKRINYNSVDNTYYYMIDITLST